MNVAAPCVRAPSIAIDTSIADALAAGAVVVFNLSGGKDSGATAQEVTHYLDGIGHPRNRRIAIHADLGFAEWQSTAAIVEGVAAALGLELVVVRRKAGDMVQRWESRFVAGKRRYLNLETYNLIGPWSSASLRFCTSELKAQVIGPYLAKRFAGQTIVQVVGIRRDESANRAKAEISKADHRYAKPGNRAGTSMLLWHPLLDWSAEQVFACHREHDLPLHEAYTSYGSTRLSCAFCILASIRDLRAASDAAGNAALYRHLVGMEADSTFSFQPDRWLGDVAPRLLAQDLAAKHRLGRDRAAERQSIEAGMPPELRYVKGWPPRAPTASEAAQIAAARRVILRHHGLPMMFTTGDAVSRRFDQLLAMKEAA
jgi:3'-phosphoadenosine 5'-phosphosulfate sulfotransferase (PAPS reductase)/FAD synthetase